MIKTAESVTLDAIRALRMVLGHEDVASVSLSMSPAAADYLQNNYRVWLAELEKSSGRSITVVADKACAPDELRFDCKNARGAKVLVEV